MKLHGIRSNKDAIGVKVWLYRYNGNKQQPILAGYREMNGGSGYGSVSAKEMIFGVDPGKEYYAMIVFPSSSDTMRVDHLTSGSNYDIKELNGFPAFYTERVNSTVRFFSDQENQPEIVKYLLILFLLVLFNLKQRKSIRIIDIIRWLASGFIFLVFIFVNEFFLYQWISPAYFIAPVIVLGLVALLHLIIERVLLRQWAEKEKMDLREKLSRDLHDDLASTQGSISIYAATLSDMKEPSLPESKILPLKIAGLTQSALQSISDIIWMTSPRNDSLQSLISKTSNYMLEVLTNNNIRFHSSIEIPDDPLILQEQIRYDVLLILKRPCTILSNTLKPKM